jgi:hypothetical protein
LRVRTIQKTSANSWRVHASVVCVPGHGGVIIFGAPASGKTTLVGYFLAQGAQLIGDDYVDISQNIVDGHAGLYARAIRNIAGLIAPRASSQIYQIAYQNETKLHYQIYLEPEGKLSPANALAFCNGALPHFPVADTWDMVQKKAKAYFENQPLAKAFSQRDAV